MALTSVLGGKLSSAIQLFASVKVVNGIKFCFLGKLYMTQNVLIQKPLCGINISLLK